MPLLSINIEGRLQPHLTQEWLLTNGLGRLCPQYARRLQHATFITACWSPPRKPPVGRIMALNRLGEILTLDGKDQPTLEFSVNQFREAFHPQGWKYLRRF